MCRVFHTHLQARIGVLSWWGAERAGQLSPQIRLNVEKISKFLSSHTKIQFFLKLAKR